MKRLLVLGLSICLAGAGSSFAAQKKLNGFEKAKIAPAIKTNISELTIKECTGLGGRVDASSAACTKAGQFTCTTTDSSGTSRSVCVDEVGQ